MLYGRVAKITRLMGYRRIITYTEEGESGASLRAAGWCLIGTRKARRGWDTPSRPREATGNENVMRYLWETKFE